MSINRLKIVISLFLFSQSIFINSQAQSIKGYVYGENKNSIEFANVMLFSSADSTFIDGTVSDSTGYFEIKKTAESSMYLKVSYLGYLDYFLTINDTNNIARIILKENEGINLNEIIVEAKVPTYSIKEDILTANVASTILGREHDINELLKKIHGVVHNGEEIEVFGLGKPSIYINGRKVQTKKEVEQLIPSNIESIQLITNPDSRYDASTKAVILIKTIKRENGLSLLLKTDDNYGRKLKQDHGILHYNQLIILYNKVIIQTQIPKKTAISPICNHCSRKVHSFYIR